MQKKLAVLFLLSLLSACSLVPVYRPSIEQGNIYDQSMIDQLTPGMTKKQVLFLMGTPVLRNDFYPSRWDYVYTLKRDDKKFFKKWVSIYFHGDTIKEVKQSYPQPPGDAVLLPLPMEATS